MTGVYIVLNAVVVGGGEMASEEKMKNVGVGKKWKKKGRGEKSLKAN